MTGDSSGQVPFQAHAGLLRSFLADRSRIVARIESVLSAEKRPSHFAYDRSFLSRQIEHCFFAALAGPDDRSRLRGQLEAAHAASGFRFRQMPELHNDLVDPAEMAIRGIYCWQQTRWPGRSGRSRYAQTLFNLYLIRCLELLSMRIWDASSDNASDRLSLVQAVLDELWQGSPGDQPILLRDARWLIPLAQSPVTDDLAGYFAVARNVADLLPDADRLEVLKAHVRILGGHLTSQIRHYCTNDGVSIDDHSVIRRTRTSNALDFALLVQGLVPLLEAYAAAVNDGDTDNRLQLAGAICQGISPDPDAFLNRVDLLGAYSMIEHLFIATEPAAQAAYSPIGRRHVGLLKQYGSLIDQLAPALNDDCPRFRPVAEAYSPYGALFGTPTNLIENMALKTLQRDAVTDFSLEDVFADGGADKLDWVNGWRQLPHIGREVQEAWAYPQQFAAEIFRRIERALHRSVAAGSANDDRRAGRLFLCPDETPAPTASSFAVPALPPRYLVSSDPEIVAGRQADACEQARLLRDRQEGHFVISFETPGGWTAIRKDMLTEVLGEGADASLVGLPAGVARAIRLLCPGLDVA